MAQPFRALPALAIAGLGVRDIMGCCVTTLPFFRRGVRRRDVPVLSGGTGGHAPPARAAAAVTPPDARARGAARGSRPPRRRARPRAASARSSHCR
nr:TIGR00366 family protein [Burkholderia ubonensis]